MSKIKIVITGFEDKEQAADWLRTYVEKGTGRMDNNALSGTPVYPVNYDDGIDEEIDEFENNDEKTFKLELE